MRNLPELYKTLASSSGRYPLIKIELYEGERKKWTDNIIETITGSNHIINATFSNGTTTQPNRFETGIAYCGELKLTLSAEYYDKIFTAQKMKVYSGFKDPNTGDMVYLSVGVFFVESSDYVEGNAKIIARDLMMYAESAFYGFNLSYPMTLTDLWRECIRQMGGKVSEDFILPINPNVISAPYIKSRYSFLDSDGNTYPGRPYTCRQIIAQIAKMQLGNAFSDGDGYIKVFSYSDVIPVTDTFVIDLSISNETYKNKVVIYQSNTELGEVQYIKDEDIYGTLVYNTFIPSDNVDSGAPSEQLKEQLKKAKAYLFHGGTVTQKAVGTAELGDWISYSGKLGEKMLFVSGIMLEWSNGSFDETIFSFAPTYETSVYTSNNTESSPSEVEDKTDNPNLGEDSNGLIIEKAIIIQEADAKYLLHEYTELDYIAGNKIGYAGAKNPVIMQNIPVCEFGAKTPNGVILPTVSTDVDTSEQLPDVQTYTTLNFPNGLYIGNAVVTKLALEPIAFSTTATDWQFKYYCADGTTGVYETFTTDNRYPTGCFIARNAIWAPNEDYPYGYATVRYGFIYAIYNSTQYRTGVNTQYSYTLPFGSETEYNAAVALTYEPVTLTEVTETITEV